MTSLAQRRLAEERKTWRKEKPFGFTAKPFKNADGSMNLLKWDCIIPGKENTDWYGGFFPLTLEFPDDYPSKPPKCKFPAGFYHPNVYPSGTVCLSIINEDEAWRPSITVKQVLTGIQELLDTPNSDSPAQSDAYLDMVKHPDVYKDKVRRQTAKYPMQ